MEKYLKVFNEIRKSGSFLDYSVLFDKIEGYIKGNIDSFELMKDTNDLAKGLIYRIINKIINYEYKDVKYFIELPKDMFYNTSGSRAIYAAETKQIDVTYNNMRTIGPEFQVKDSPIFHDNHYIEITGDFSKYPNGVMLYYSDWFKIIAKYPNIYNLMYHLYTTDYEFKNKYKNITIERIKSEFNNKLNIETNNLQDGEPNFWWNGKSEAMYVTQDFIDSIEFVVPKIYLSYDQVISEDFVSFEELLNGNEPYSRKLS